MGESPIQGGALVRVLAVPQRLRQRRLQNQHRRQRCRGLFQRQRRLNKPGWLGRRGSKNFDQMRGDRGIVGGGACEHARRQLAPQRRGRVATGFDLRGDVAVVARVHHHRDILMIFRGTAEQGRSANVDVFNRFHQRDIRFRHGLFEGIKVDDDQINGTDAVLFDGGFVFRIAPDEQHPAVDFRVEGFHAAIQHFGEPSMVGQFDQRHAGVAQDLGGAAGGHQLHVRRDESLRERNKPGLIED